MCVIFWTVVLIFIVVSCNTMFQPLYPLAILRWLCLFGHRNDSTWEVIFIVWLLIKQSIQELWRCYSNNGIIVFHANQSEKHHEMNSKQNPITSVILDIFIVIFFKNNLIWPFQLLIPKSFGLVSLFNGISTFVGYLMPKPFS